MSEDNPTIHGTLVQVEQQGLLLRGPSGSGKSDLALRLIAGSFANDICTTPPKLVADDRVIIEQRGRKLYGRAPKTLKGLLEIRHIGIETVPFVSEAAITALVEFKPVTALERLPKKTWDTEQLLGVNLPLIALDQSEASAPIKLIFAAKKLTETTDVK